MSKIIRSAVFIIVAFSLCSCDFIWRGKSMLNKKIQNIEINKAVKVENIIDGQWDTACILVPYQKFLKDGGSENIKDINREIENGKLSIDEGHWHLILKGSEKTFFMSERVSNVFSVKQGGFSGSISELFSENNFNPLSCAIFKEAYFFKYKQNNCIYLSLGVKIL